MNAWPMLAGITLALSLAPAPARAAAPENWPGFRGPTGQGLSTGPALPLHWSATSNVLWKTEVPGDGWSSPIVWGSRVFLTAAAENGQSCRVLCFDAGSGRLLWNQEAFQQVPRHKQARNSFATPT